MLSVVVPAYNEAPNIRNFIRETAAVLEEAHIEYEIIVVDDGSRDSTREEALAAGEDCPFVKVCSYPENKGKGYALKFGFQSAIGDPIMFLDADLDLSPRMIPRFIDCMAGGEAEVVIGSKWHPLSRLDFPFSRRVFSKAYHYFTKVLLNIKVSDTQTGIKLYKREVLERILPTLEVNRFAFDVELLVKGSRFGYPVGEVPIELTFHGRSNVNFKAVLRMFFDTVKLSYKLRIVDHLKKRTEP